MRRGRPATSVAATPVTATPVTATPVTGPAGGPPAEGSSRPARAGCGVRSRRDGAIGGSQTPGDRCPVTVARRTETNPAHRTAIPRTGRRHRYDVGPRSG
ncbi:hypothetical protein SSP531S_53370 [Streptomyces spongiicola]|uniref:Uncharacterized protein n=1 Tax=Streptomyces spongiicola TaxID=1690221 RepID=A0A388T512_9ACTN|nr:hypothetical protein SSP531S_53370 [Streptomyces spongiicola]